MSESSNGAAPSAAVLLKHARKRRYGELETAWMTAVEDETVGLDDLVAVLRELARLNEAERVESLFWFLLAARTERGGPEEGLEAARQAAAILPESNDLREELASLYGRASPTIPEIETLVEMTLLRDDIALATALERMEKLLLLRPGTYVFDRRRQKPGRVAGLAAGKQRLEVAFGEDLTATYDALSMERLDILEADDFRALAALDPGRLKGLAEHDPAALVELALKAFGSPLSLRDLKARVVEVVPGASWSKWWARAKPLIRRAPMVGMSEDVRATFTLRSGPVAFEDEVKARFDTAASAEDKLVVILDYLTETAGGAADADALAHFAGELARGFDEWCVTEPAAAMGALALMAEIHTRLPDRAPEPPGAAEPLLFEHSDLSVLLTPLGSDRLVKHILGFVRRTLPGRWFEVYAAVLPGCSHGVCEWIAKELTENGHEEGLRAAVHVVLARQHRCLSALVWLWKAACANKFPQALGGIDRPAVLVRLLSAANSLARAADADRARQRALLNQVRGALSARDYAPLRASLEGAVDDEARRLANVIERDAALSEHGRSRIREILRQTHSALFVRDLPPWEEDAVYTTPAGLDRLHREIDGVLEKIARNRKAIGEAAAHGDLSENAEFTAAMEERGRLTEKAARLQEDFAKTRIIGRDMAQSQTVTVGSAVQVRDPSSGRARTFAFLGPWDVDSAKGIYSYRARVGLALMGKKKGDRVAVVTGAEKRIWEIVDIRVGI